MVPSKSNSFREALVQCINSVVLYRWMVASAMDLYQAINLKASSATTLWYSMATSILLLPTKLFHEPLVPTQKLTPA
jgi:hypothetical protein